MIKSNVTPHNVFSQERFSVLDSGNTLGQLDLTEAVKQVRERETTVSDTGCNHWGWGDTPEKTCNHWGFDN